MTLSVVQMTSVHPATDPRIFHKQCRSLAAAGYDVVFVVPEAEDSVVDGVKLKAVPRVSSRPGRIVGTTWRVWREAMRSSARICHFHDPELIPAGLMLRLAGRKVVYDVHEDYVTSITQKPYLPPWVARTVAALFDGFERLASRAFAVVLAERYYQERFPRGLQVLNHPRLEDLPAAGDAPRLERPHFLYTGNAGHDRGSRQHARLLGRNPDVSLTMIGRCRPGVAGEIRADAGENVGNLTLMGENAYVPYAEIIAAYERGGWTAGLALFPLTEHYRRKELTKFFEYMAAGIPVLCSDFPAWRAVIEKEGCGLCVDPDDDGAVDEAVRWFVENPDEAREMGARGRRAVSERYHWDLQAAKLLDLYRSLGA